MPDRGIRDYTGSAADYDAKRYMSEPDAFIDNIRREKLERLLVANGGLLLDVATGTGSGMIFASSVVKMMVGVDATHAMLLEAGKKVMRENIKNAARVRSNALRLPFKDETFDIVISLNFLHLFTPVSDQLVFMDEMMRVAKKGSSVIVEIDNALEGGILGIIRKYFVKDIGYNWPWDIYKLSRGMSLEKVDGIALPGTKKFSIVNKRFAADYSRLASVFPFIYLADRLLVKFKKR